jgi:hypothetical protein
MRYKSTIVLTVLTVLGSWGLLTLLFLFPVYEVGSLGFTVLFTLLSSIFFFYFYSDVVFKKRAIADRTFAQDAKVKKIFTGGAIKAISLSFSVSLLLLLFVWTLGPIEWVVLYVAVLVTVWKSVWILNTQQVQQVINSDERVLISLKPVLWVVSLLLLIAFILIRIFVPDTSDLRGLPIETAFKAGMSSLNVVAPLSIPQTLASWVNGVEFIKLSILQTFLGSSVNGILTWVVVILASLFDVVKVILVVYIPISILHILLTRIQRNSSEQVKGSQNSFMLGFWMMLGIIFSVVLLIVMFAESASQQYSKTQEGFAVEHSKGGCNDEEWANEQARLIDDSSDTLAIEVQNYQKQSDYLIDKKLDLAFSQATIGVDKFLDWNFSVVGEYQMLLAKARSGLDELFAEKFEETVYKDLSLQLTTFDVELDNLYNNQMLPILKQNGEQLVKHMSESACIKNDINENDITAITHNPKVGAALLLTPVATKISASAGAKALVNSFAIKLSAMLAAKLSISMAAKLGISMAAGTTGVLCGPLAWVCGGAAAITTWFSVDAVVASGDEYLNREEMKTELLSQLQRDKEQLKADLKTSHSVNLFNHLNAFKKHQKRALYEYYVR